MILKVPLCFMFVSRAESIILEEKDWTEGLDEWTKQRKH